ncbi:MAG: hypothetical protein LUQ26_09925 [Methylococcaceae bacterium]|nr:hypothetical protein [Methylococcaceae bacterium]
MITGYDPASESGYVKLSDKVEAAIRNINMFLYNVDVYDENCELLIKFALPQLEEVRKRLKQ